MLQFGMVFLIKRLEAKNLAKLTKLGLPTLVLNVCSVVGTLWIIIDNNNVDYVCYNL